MSEGNLTISSVHLYTSLKAGSRVEILNSHCKAPVKGKTSSVIPVSQPEPRAHPIYWNFDSLTLSTRPLFFPSIKSSGINKTWPFRQSYKLVWKEILSSYLKVQSCDSQVGMRVKLEHFGWLSYSIIPVCKQPMGKNMICFTTVGGLSND